MAWWCAGSSPLDGASTAASSPRNDFVKNYPDTLLISAQVENPFNFADVDHDLDSFSKRLHDETLVVAREVAPPNTRCRDYWITERKGFAARNGSKRKKKKRTGEGYFKQVSEKLVTYHDEL